MKKIPALLPRAAIVGATLLLALRGMGDDAILDAMRVPNADVAAVVNAAKILASPFVQKAKPLFEKVKKIAAANEFDAFDFVDEINALFTAGELSLPDLKKLAFSVNLAELIENGKKGKDEPPNVILAVLFEKPITDESFKKSFTKLASLVGAGDILTFNGKDAVTKDDFFASLLENDRVIFAGSEDSVNAAKTRAKDNTRADALPVMKILLDEKLTQKDAWFAFIPPEEVRDEMFEDLFDDLLPYDYDLPESVEKAMQNITGITVAVDVSDKVAVAVNAVFATPEAAKVFGDFASVMLVGSLKQTVYEEMGSNMPFLDSLKVAASGTTATLSFEVTIQDLEMVLARMTPDVEINDDEDGVSSRSAKEKARAIWVAIVSANTERLILDLTPLWPGDLAKDGKKFTNAEAYFTYLMSDGEPPYTIAENPGDRIVGDLKPEMLVLPGMKPAKAGEVVGPENNAWHVAGIHETQSWRMPFLISRNAKASDIVYPTSKEMDKMSDSINIRLGRDVKPFGFEKAVWVSKGGAPRSELAIHFTRANVCPVKKTEGDPELTVLPAQGGFQ